MTRAFTPLQSRAYLSWFKQRKATMPTFWTSNQNSRNSAHCEGWFWWFTQCKQDQVIAARLNLALSGTKQELFHRLLNPERKYTRGYQFPRAKSQTKRVSGRHFLWVWKLIISSTCIWNRILEIQAVMQMNENFQRNAELYYAQHGFPVNFTNCHGNSRLQINKKICDFCLNKASCNEQESRTSEQSIDVIFETLNTNDVEEDINRISEWFNRRKQEQHLFPNAYRIFSDPVNPFRPGFVSGKSNQIFLTVLSEVNTVSSSASCSWNHLFFLTLGHSLHLNHYTLMPQFFSQYIGKFRA